MLVVQLKNLQAQWDSLEEKDIFLSQLYPFLLELADDLNTDDIQFIGNIQTLH
jgi:hypothetical protein